MKVPKYCHTSVRLVQSNNIHLKNTIDCSEITKNNPYSTVDVCTIVYAGAYVGFLRGGAQL